MRNARAGTPEACLQGATLERSKEEVLRAARPLPPDDEVLEDLTEDEDRVFLDAILNA